MKKIKNILNKIEALIYMVATGEAAYLRFHQPYDFFCWICPLFFYIFGVLFNT